MFSYDLYDDYILENCEYDYEVADKILAKDMVTENKNQTQSAWAILMRKKGICMSLSAVYQILGIKMGMVGVLLGMNTI